MKKFTALFIAAVLLSGLAAIPASAATTDFAAKILALVNAERAAAGLNPVSGSNKALNAAAQKRAT